MTVSTRASSRIVDRLRTDAIPAILLGLALFAPSTGTARAAAPAPAAKLQSSDQAFMNTPFALDYCNWRVQKITWMPDSAPLMQKLNVGSNTGLGSLVLTVAIKNNSSTNREVPEPRISAIFKDGTANDNNGGSTAYTAGSLSIHANYPPGSGGTILFVVPNVQQPSASNPITKLVFYQSYPELKPQLIRLLAPPVTVMPTPAPEPDPT